MKQHKTLAFQAAPGFFETNREVPAFFFEKNCLIQNPDPLGKSLTSRPMGCANPPGGGGGGLCSGLELVDTSGATYYVSLVKKLG